MTSKTKKKLIEEALDKLCAHPLFVNSAVYTRLLQYLVKKAINKEDIKEYTIGYDLFEKNYINDKNDGTVRTHMYKLRKKLDTYYADKNSHNEIIFKIKKGQYNLDFISKKEYNQNIKSPVLKIPLKYVKLISFVFLSTVTTILILENFHGRPPSLWSSFLKEKSSNLVVISDQYTFMHTNAYEEQHPTMYSGINSDEDFLTYKKEHPKQKLDITDFTLVSKMAPYGIKNLDEWFFSWGSNFKLELESNLTLNHIKENNIIFIGQFKTMNLSKSFFLKDSKVFKTYEDGFKFSKNDEEKIYTTHVASNKKVEYALVSFATLSSNKDALFFVSNNDIGVMATLRLFTNKNWLRTLSEKLPEKASKFNALFEVSGFQRTHMSSKLIELEIIED